MNSRLEKGRLWEQPKGKIMRVLCTKVVAKRKEEVLDFPSIKNIKIFMLLVIEILVVACDSQLAQLEMLQKLV